MRFHLGSDDTWVEMELEHLFIRFRASATGPERAAIVTSRLEADLIGLDLNLMVMTTKGAYSAEYGGSSMEED